MSQDSSDGFPPASGRGPAAAPRSWQGPLGQMDVAPDDLKSTISRAFDTEGGELGRALVAKMNELLAVGNFWGDDSTGAKFYNGDADLPGYASMVEGVATEASAISLFYVQVGDRLYDMGRNVEVAEWRTIGEMPRVPE